LPTRAWELLAGAFTALYLKEKRVKEAGRVIGKIGSIFGVFLIIFSLVLFDKDTPFPGLLALIPVLGTVLIVLFAEQNNFVGRILGNRIPVGIGLMSYSAYLWHQPLFSLATHRRLEIPNTTSSLVLFVITFLLGYLTWRFVELPFRKRDKIKQATVFKLATTLSIAVVIFGSYGYTSNGFSNRFEKILSGDTAQLQFHNYIDQNFYDCEPSSIAKSALSWDSYLRCKQSKPGVPDVVILGDSHAEHLFIGVAESLPELNAAFYIQSGGPFIDNPQFKEIFGELLSNSEKQHIILTMYLSKRSIDSNELYSGFAKTINALLKSGKTVTLTGDVPQLKIEPGMCLYRNSVSNQSVCNLSFEEIKLQSSKYEETLINLSLEFETQYLSLDPAFCSEVKCSISNNGSILYRDNNHLNIIGSRLVGNYVVDKLSFRAKF
jgi:hypothetical protein